MTTENQAPEGGELPPFPVGATVMGAQSFYYTAEQMQAYARAALAVQLQAAHRVLAKCRPFVAFAFDQGIVGAEEAGMELDAFMQATAAQPRAPLSERAILDLVPSNMPLSNDFELLWFARAVERAHGIPAPKEPTNDR